MQFAAINVMPMNIREATSEDSKPIWPILHEIAAAGETCA